MLYQDKAIKQFSKTSRASVTSSIKISLVDLSDDNKEKLRPNEYQINKNQKNLVWHWKAVTRADVV